MIDVSPYVQTLNNRSVAVFGLARSGLATVRALIAADATVIAWDDRPEAQDKARDLGAEIKALDESILKTCAALVIAPGVPLTHNPHAVVTAARAAGVEIISDIEILQRCNHGRTVIGITGTNGKSTTTALISHVLGEAGVSYACGGNIGVPALALDMPDDGGAFVLELSSYQLDLCPTFAPDIAVLLNITPDHLDRHGTMAEYVRAKARIFDGTETAIIGGQATGFVKIADALRSSFGLGQKDAFLKQSSTSLANPQQGLATHTNKFYIAKNSMRNMEGHIGEGVEEITQVATTDRMIYDSDKIVGDFTGVQTLPGDHNMQNVAAAYAALKIFGIDTAQIVSGMKTFPGLPHRQFLVRQIRNVMYVNDSKATNAEATSKALASYDDNIFLIAGGQPKDGGLSGLTDLWPRVHSVFLIGEASDEFADQLKKQNVSYSKCETLDVAVRDAHLAAQNHGRGVVLLSPACASFDQFPSYEHRGDAFVKLVKGV